MKVEFGNHFLHNANFKDRERLLRFYRDGLGLKIKSQDDITEGSSSQNIDIILFPNNIFLGIGYHPNEKKLLSPNQWTHALWFEMLTDEVENLKTKVLKFGATEIDWFWDKGHYYFQDPVGLVFRIVENK